MTSYSYTSHKLICYACMFTGADLGSQVECLDSLKIRNPRMSCQ